MPFNILTLEVGGLLTIILPFTGFSSLETGPSPHTAGIFQDMEQDSVLSSFSVKCALNSG